MNAFAQYVLSGLSSGCLYAFVALSLVLIARVTAVYNFAQGDYVMVSGMVFVSASQAGAPLPLAVLAGVAAVAGIAFLQERLTVAPVAGRMSPLGLAVITLGVGVLIRGAALLIWGHEPRSAEPFTPGTFGLAGARLDNQTLWIWATTLVVLLGVTYLFQWTAIGKAMRACAANPTAARLLGIRRARMSTLAFVVAGALTGLAGAVVVPLSTVGWDTGLTVGLIGFIAAAVANFQHLGRAVAVGLAMGVIQNVAAGELSSGYRDLFVYGVLLAYLLGRDLAGEDGIVRRWQLARVSRRAARAKPAVNVQRQALIHKQVVEQPREFRYAALSPLLLIGLLAVLPFMLPVGGQAMSAAILVVLGAIGATGLVLVMGLTGLFNLGVAAFYLTAGYAVAILTVTYGWDPLTAVVVGTALSAVMGALVGGLTLRLQGFNLAIATLAIHFMLIVWASQAEELTGGSLGLVGIPPLSVFGWDLSVQANFYWAALIALVGCLLLARNLTQSRVGRALRAIGAEEDSARALALNVYRLKLLIFVVGAGMAGLGGGLWACYVQLATPSTWDFNLTITLVTFAIVGGLGSVYGGLIGAIIVGGIQYLIRVQTTTLASDSSNYEVILNGAFLIVFLLVFRDGLAVTFGAERMRARLARYRDHGLPEEPLRDAAVPVEAIDGMPEGSARGAAS
jgi:branched-chain amino acid transport system permease protein